MIIGLVWAAAALFTPPTPSFDPGRNWFTFGTPNFDVHFSSFGKPAADATDLAREVARICEEVRATLGDSTGAYVSEPVQVVIADFHDYSNGWAVPFPYPTMTVIPTPPAGSRTGDDNWLRTLILHEYSHLLQLHRAEGFNLFLRRLFGGIVLPNALLPSWLVEGYAVYNETRFTNSGRLRSPARTMMLKAAADAGRLLPIDQCDGYELQRWPGGDAPYLYGGAFADHIAGLTRPGIWDEFNRSHSRLLPLCENLSARALLGRGFNRLWREWQSTVSAETTRNPTGFVQLTEHSFYTSSPCWSRTGNELFYVCRTGREMTAIKALDLRTRESRVIHRGYVFGPLALSPDGRSLAFSEFRVIRNGALTSDIMTVDVVSGTVRRLTDGERARDPDFAPDTSALVFVSNREGRNDLILLDITSGERHTLTRTGDRTGYSSPRFSPGGRWIAVSVSRPGGYSDIELIDRNTGWSVAVTSDRATDLSPAWSRTGKTLFFVSDRSGRFDLYACSVEDKRIYRCREADYGLFEPAVSPDNRSLALVAHSADGEDIVSVPLDVAGWKPAADFDDNLPSNEFTPAALEPALYYYSPYPTVLPRFWLPWVARPSGWEFGAFTSGWDVLQHHLYTAAGGWNAARSTPFVHAEYTWSRFRPSVTVIADATLHDQKVGLNLALPFALTYCNHWLDFGPSLVRDPLLALSLQGSWLYSDARTYRFCVAPVEGTVAGVGIDGRLRNVLNTADRFRAVVHATRYLGAPPATWSLRLRAAAGIAAGDTSRSSAFRLSNEASLLRVRGFADPGEPGSCAAVAGLQLRVPIWWPERGIGTLPLFLRNLNTAAFGDAGTVWNRFEPSHLGARTRVGIGAELRADLFVFRYVPVRITLGLAAGLLPEPDRQFYFRLDSEMLAALVKRTAAEWYFARKTPEPD
uniref:Bacterial surface antigen (D15) domain-containing protein n=1 Tax=candidate division WOR-3 bacterium TaxID=2052148 RepID=A0A7C4GEL2_UNCW3